MRLVTQNIVIIVIYVAFMLVEDQRFNAKLKHLFPNRDDYARAQQVLGAIGKKIQAYLAVKTLMSLITAVLAYIILLVFDINYAPVWAMLVFFLNFIPVVGSIIAVILPMAMAVLQFWEISPWVIFVVTGLLIGVQQFVGSFLEPRFLGSSLNLSPLIILVSLSFWGFLWGPVGMLISVPVTVMMAIIFASVPATRWVAVLLSQNGDSVQEEFGPVVMPTTGRTTDPS